MNKLKQHQKPDIKRRFCCQCGEITKELVVYFELLPPNRTINSDVCIEQLTKLNNAVEEKQPKMANREGIVFHHDTARPHTYLATRQKLLELGWDVLPHPPYNTDLAPI